MALGCTCHQVKHLQLCGKQITNSDVFYYKLCRYYISLKPSLDSTWRPVVWLLNFLCLCMALWICFSYDNITVSIIRKQFWHAGVLFVYICKKPYYTVLYILQYYLVYLVIYNQPDVIKTREQKI